jgi:hypothetical protein
MSDQSRKRTMEQAFGEPEGKAKIGGEGALQIRCLLDAKKAGSLIGKKGTVISSFRDQSGAFDI